MLSHLPMIKVGIPVMLLHNMKTSYGLAYSTNPTVQQAGSPFPKSPFEHFSSLERRSPSVRNDKSQGLCLSKWASFFLLEPCVNHGQLYIAQECMGVPDGV